MRIDATTLRRMWPRAPQALIDAVAEHSAAVFARHGLTTPLRVAHFMAQISHESGGGTITEESLNYTTASRIAAVWPRRFTVESAAGYTHNARKLADKVYNGRMGNHPGTDDGYDYRGRGLLQITGRESYREIGKLCGLPLEERPELAYAPNEALEVAATEFEHLGCLPYCDKDQIEAVTRRVNGGYIGLASRKSWLAKWKQVRFREDAGPAVQQVPAPHPPAPEPEPPEVPRGSDDTLPPGVDHPNKTMRGSKSGWAAILGAITAIGTAVGQAVDSVKPLLADPRMVALIVVIALGVGAFLWFDRRKRLMADR